MKSVINKIRWLYDRWAVMQHPAEELYRINQQYQYHIADRRWYAHPPKPLALRYISDNTVKDRYSIDGLKSIFDDVTVDDMKAYRLLNTRIPDILSNDQWNYDFKNGMKGQQCFVHHIDDFDYSKGEVKYIYELSRLYFLPVFAGYGVAKSDTQMIARIKEILHDWLKQNPFLGTIAWKSGNVVGIRTVNLLITYMLMKIVDNDNDFDAFFADIMSLHYRYLITHQSRYSSNGNHRIGELTGIISITSVFEFDEAEKALKQSFNELSKHLLTMINPDGGNREQATRYQASLISLFTIAEIFAESRGLSLNVECKQRLREMYKFLKAFQVAPYQMMVVGDDDDAQLIYPHFDKHFDLYESVLNDYTIINGQEVRSDYYHFDYRNYIIFGDKGMRLYNTLTPIDTIANGCNLYPESGYVLYHSEETDFMFDIGEIGLPPTMAHGHSDILSFDLYVNKRPVLIDSGSYQYNAHFKKYRDYFHGVDSHNTISIGGVSQARKSEGMFWRSYPKVDIIKTDTNDMEFTASHDGYCRDGHKSTHRRTLKYDMDKKEYIITDIIETDTPAECKFYLHFHPTVNVVHNNDTLMADLCTIQSSIFRKGQLVKGEAGTPLGWYSPSYDCIEPTYTFVSPFMVQDKVEIVTHIQLNINQTKQCVE